MKSSIAFSSQILLVLVAGSHLSEVSLAWSSGSDSCRQPHYTKDLSQENRFPTQNPTSTITRTSRREFLAATLIATSTIGGVVVAVPTPALADVTNKIASTAALRALKRAQVQLPIKVLPEARANNFVGIKARLREAPFDDVRKTGRVLVRGGEDGPKADALSLAYQELIRSLEAIDATASLGMRGRTVDPFRMGIEYEAIAKALDAFVALGTEAATIPLQEQTPFSSM